MSAGGQRVLLLGEEPTLAGALAATLGRRGHHVEVVGDAAEARAHPAPDVLVAALEAGADEVSSLVRVWQRGGAAPRALWLTDRPGPDAYRALSRCGGVVLVKPLRMSEFLRAVEKSGSRARARAVWHRASIPDPVEAVARDLIAFGAAFGLGPAVRARLAGAACELVENAAQHAYPDSAGDIDLRVELGDRALWLAVEDHGTGFHPPPFLRPGGGLARAAALCESLRLDSTPGVGTQTVLRFDVQSLNQESLNQEGLELEDAPLFDLSDRDSLTPRETRALMEELRNDPRGARYVLPPSLAVVVGRLLAGAEPEVFLGGTRCVSTGS